MFPQENVLKTNALRLIMGHFLVHMHTLASTYPCKIDYFIVIMPSNVNMNGFWGGYPMGVSPPV